MAVVHRLGQLVADGLAEGARLAKAAEARLPLVDRRRVSLIVRVGGGAVQCGHGELDVREDLFSGCGVGWFVGVGGIGGRGQAEGKSVNPRVFVDSRIILNRLPTDNCDSISEQREV